MITYGTLRIVTEQWWRLPDEGIARWIGLAHDQRYWTCLIGLAVFGVVYILQRPRIPKPAEAPAAA